MRVVVAKTLYTFARHTLIDELMTGMNDIGLLTTYDTLIIVLIGMAPGMLLGMIMGALCWKARRIVGSILGLFIGALVFITGWLVYFVWFK